MSKTKRRREGPATAALDRAREALGRPPYRSQDDEVAALRRACVEMLEVLECASTVEGTQIDCPSCGALVDGWAVIEGTCGRCAHEDAESRYRSVCKDLDKALARLSQVEGERERCLVAVLNVQTGLERLEHDAEQRKDYIGAAHYKAQAEAVGDVLDALRSQGVAGCP